MAEVIENDYLTSLILSTDDFIILFSIHLVKFFSFLVRWRVAARHTYSSMDPSTR